MSRRWLLLVPLLAVVAAALFWIEQGDESTEPPAPVERSEEPAAELPVLVGTGADAVAAEPEAATAPGKRRSWETRRGFDLAQEGDVRTHGRVVFADGSPAPGAFVWRTYVYRPFFRADAEAGAHGFHKAATKTDREGRYRFSHAQIPLGLHSDALLARHGDQCALLLEIEERDKPISEAPDLVLGPAIVARIDVVNAYGDPVAGARGTLRVHHGGKGIPLLLLADTGDPSGRLTFLPLPDREDLLLELVLLHPDYGDLKQDLDVGRLRREGALRVELPTGRTVRGRLVTITGEAPSYATVLTSGHDPGWVKQRLCDGVGCQAGADGTFELRGVPTSDARVLFYLASKEDESRRGASSLLQAMPAHVIELDAGRHGELLDLGLILLTERQTIRGVVRDGDGMPLADVRVTATLPVAGLPGSGYAEARTDVEGRFELPELPAAAFEVRASREFEGFGRRLVIATDVIPGGEPLEFRLGGGSALVVRFHPEGRPDAELRVKSYGYRKLQLRADGDGYEESGAFGGSGRSSSGRSLARIRLDPGTHKIVITAEGFRDVEVGPFEITADADTVIDLELTPE